jgi:hypothetical protein
LIKSNQHLIKFINSSIQNNQHAKELTNQLSAISHIHRKNPKTSQINPAADQTHEFSNQLTRSMNQSANEIILRAHFSTEKTLTFSENF